MKKEYAVPEADFTAYKIENIIAFSCDMIDENDPESLYGSEGIGGGVVEPIE